MKKLILKHVTNGCFWMNFAVFFKFCTFEKMPKNQLLAKKTGYFGTYGAFWPFSLAQAQTSLKKFCAGLLMDFHSGTTTRFRQITNQTTLLSRVQMVLFLFFSLSIDSTLLYACPKAC